MGDATRFVPVLIMDDMLACNTPAIAETLRERFPAYGRRPRGSVPHVTMPVVVSSAVQDDIDRMIANRARAGRPARLDCWAISVRSIFFAPVARGSASVARDVRLAVGLEVLPYHSPVKEWYVLGTQESSGFLKCPNALKNGGAGHEGLEPSSLKARRHTSSIPIIHKR